MVYLEAESQKAILRGYVPTKDDMQRLRQLIEAVYAKIVSYDLPDASCYTPDLAGLIAFEDDLIEGRC